MKSNTVNESIGIRAVALLCIVMIAFSSGCTSTDEAASSPVQGASSYTAPNSTVEKVEIFHFHGNPQCYSCITLGDYAEETVNSYFADEVKAGRVVFAHVNGELQENAGLVKKYGATGSSLWIGVYKKDGTFSKEQNINVWYKINNKSEFMEYLKGVIEGKLKG